MAKLITFNAFEFRNGIREVLVLRRESTAMVLDHLRKHGLLRDGIKESIETTVIVQASPPSRRGSHGDFTHTLRHLERKQPHTLFVAAMEVAEFKRLSQEANEAFDKREQEIQRWIEQTRDIHSKVVAWEDMPPYYLRIDIERTKKSCWLWPLNKEGKGPYKAVYEKTKGPLLKGVMLLHSCDNPRCINPNHLRPGTAADNSKDMVRRRRHRSQRA